jgi:hypothetical protein
VEWIVVKKEKKTRRYHISCARRVSAITFIWHVQKTIIHVTFAMRENNTTSFPSKYSSNLRTIINENKLS